MRLERDCIRGVGEPPRDLMTPELHAPLEFALGGVHWRIARGVALRGPGLKPWFAAIQPRVSVRRAAGF